MKSADTPGTPKTRGKQTADQSGADQVERYCGSRRATYDSIYQIENNRRGQ